MRRGMMELAAALLVVSVVGWLWLNRAKPVSKPTPVASDIIESPKGPSPSAPRAAPPPAAAAPASPAAKVALLGEILESRNDNDPRLDTEFRHLDQPTKQALIDYYHRLPVEDANGRGTIVFLLGREIRGPGDLPFFDQVLAERVPKLPPTREGSLPMELLAAYPQVMAVSAL